jgi:hypothetical protein
MSVNLSEFPNQLNSALGFGPTSIAGPITATLIFMSLFLFPILFACSKFRWQPMIPALLIGFMSLVVGVVVFAVPYWVLLVVAMITAAMMAGTMRDWITGHGGGS